MSLSQIAAMISYLETMFGGGEGKLKEMWWRCWWRKRNVMVSIEEGKLMKKWWWKENIEAFLKKKKWTLTASRNSNYHDSSYGQGWKCCHPPPSAMLYSLLYSLSSTSTRLQCHQAHDVCYASPNSHRRTVNNYLLYIIGVNIPYTAACKPSHLLAPKVISPSACIRL